MSPSLPGLPGSWISVFSAGRSPMTAREMIDNLSGTLLCDDRILSVPERNLLTNLLQRTQTQTSAPGNDVAEAITRAVGEIIAERALGVLGESMTRQLLQQQLASSLQRTVPVIRAGTPGTPPPSPSPGTRPPGTSPPPISFATVTAQPKTGGVAVLETEGYLPAQCVVLDEFLTFAELNTLRQYVLEREPQFEISEVLSPGVHGSAVDYETRRSRVLMNLGGHERMITDRVLNYCQQPRRLLPLPQRQWRGGSRGSRNHFCLFLPSRAEAVQWRRTAHLRLATGKR